MAVAMSVNYYTTGLLDRRLERRVKEQWNFTIGGKQNGNRA